MIQVATWAERKTGDLFFVRGITPILSTAIEDFERHLHPLYKGEWVPSHTGVVGPNDTVIEAWLNRREDSAAAVNPASKYEGKDVKLFRFEAPQQLVTEALISFLEDYQSLHYAWANLLGFAWEAIAGGNNPINEGSVCSQAMRQYCRYVDLKTGAAKFVNLLPVRNADPLGLYLMVANVR